MKFIRYSKFKGFDVSSVNLGDLMDALYRSWRRLDAPAKKCHSIKKLRREALWVNFA